MKNNQRLTDITARVVTGLQDALAELKPDLILVQGDTTTEQQCRNTADPRSGNDVANRPEFING
jgi:hypothetical protein